MSGLGRDHLAKRRDELQALYDQAHNQARELAGAIAVLDELIGRADEEAAAEPPTPKRKRQTKEQ